MTLKEQITKAINPENYDTSNNLNVDLSEKDTGESAQTFEDQMIMIPGFKWESYISFNAEIYIDYTNGGGFNEAEWSEVEVTSKEISDIEICIDGLVIAEINKPLFKEVNDLILASINITFN